MTREYYRKKLTVNDCFALRIADAIAGIANAARKAMIATTTKSSTNVKACLLGLKIMPLYFI